MIGIAANAADLQIAGEFFELFKTPWERAVPARKYRVVLSTEGLVENLDADLVLMYGSGEETADRAAAIGVEQSNGPVSVEWGGSTVPIYGRVALFSGGTGGGVLTCGGKTLDCQYRSKTRVVRRIGYDLFQEIRHLLTTGQPPSQASTPTLDLHIALLRHLLLEAGVAFLEIPPSPGGYDFTCCLTHDVDFFGIRRHKVDRTLAGFVARASFGTLADVIRGRRSLGEAARNWAALLSLPLVFLGLARDFWQPFEDYAGIEDGRRSTFFLVPFKGRAGIGPDGAVDAARAVPYQISEISDEVGKAVARGSELAVHGIDAWRDQDAGRSEMNELTLRAGRTSSGIRMHWLYFAADSPQRLEAAGFDYDSTWGYNEAVGYRAGTSQVFRLPGCERLMELPLSIMDSALLSPTRMGLDHNEALDLCRGIVANARRFGGTVVINWHGRSLAPERLWGRLYHELRQVVGAGDRAWFTTAGAAVDWFRWRRSISFRLDASSDVEAVNVSARASISPGGLIRIHRPGLRGVRVEDRAFDGRTPVDVNVYMRPLQAQT